MAAARDGGACIVPIDSEHNAIFQCLEGRDSGFGMTSHSAVESRDSAKQVEGVRRIVLTASGGPFRGRDRAQLADVTPAQAIAPPKGAMGPKTSVDPATPLNQGREGHEAPPRSGTP